MKTEEYFKAFFPPFVFVVVAIICAAILEMVNLGIYVSIPILLIGLSFGAIFETLVSERYRRFIGEEYDVLKLSTKGQVIRVACLLLCLALSVFVLFDSRPLFSVFAAGTVIGFIFCTFTLNLQNSLHESPWLRKHMTKKE